MAKVGRPRTHSDEDIGRVLDLIGEERLSLTKACAKAGISVHAVWDRVKSTPDLGQRYARARERFCEANIEQIHDIAVNEPDVQRARLMIDVIKWEASKVLQGTYGDRVQVAGDAAQPLVVQVLKLGANDPASK